MVGSSWDIAKFIVFIVDGHGIRVKPVVLFPDQVELGTDLQVLKGLTALPIAKSCDVEVVQMDLLDVVVSYRSHKANDLIVTVSENKVNIRLYQNTVQPEKRY